MPTKLNLSAVLKFLAPDLLQLFVGGVMEPQLGNTNHALSAVNMATPLDLDCWLTISPLHNQLLIKY